MCDQCAEETQKSTQHKSSRRKKLWEVESILTCPILGTCLSMEDLRKVVRQCGITFEERPSDYDLHTTMVEQANRKGKASRYMHKVMDRKYDRWIQLLAHCRESAELERYWQAALDSGDIPGNYWAIMTHPYSSDDLIFRMFGDVHMLSHLQGASNRADLKRLKNLESDVVELQETLKKQRKKHNEQIQKHNEQVQHRDEIIH